MSEMEPEVKDFLKKVMMAVFVAIGWMMINITAGIYFELMIIKNRVSTGNVIYYLFFLLSLAWLIRYYYRAWVK
jgi:hypothetical protein